MRKQFTFFQKRKKERKRKQQLRGYLKIYCINVLLNRRVTVAYSIIG